MKVLSEHIKQDSIEKALSTDSFLLDGRDLKDRLHFLSQYAALINFYDDENNLRGNWQPILMKDPLILLANISRFDVHSIQQQYLHTLNHLNYLLSNKAANFRAGTLVNQLFKLLTKLFLNLERWTHFMDKYQHTYALRHYLFQEIEQKYASVLRSLLAFQERINIYVLLPAVDAVKRGVFEEFNASLWSAKNARSFWKVLKLEVDTSRNSLKKELMALSAEAIVKSLKEVGKEVIAFVQLVVKAAEREFEKVEKYPSPFPDTVLLKAFSTLMLQQQQELNSLTDKHLELYYQSILHQQLKTATADRAFISAQLNQKTSNFLLPKGTRFKAGLDENKKEVLFETLKDESLYQARINSAYTLSVQPKGNHEVLKLGSIEHPSKVNKDKGGKVISWPTFGGANAAATTQEMGLAIASPMLYLKEGNRTIRFLFEVVAHESNLEQFSLGKYYLSTLTKWLAVTPTVSHLQALSTDEIQMIAVDIELTEKTEAIEAFKQNPDGYQSSWPLLKIQFNAFVNLKVPPKISAVTIEVAVSGLKQLDLYNDFGKVNPQKPFQLFGPAPAKNSNFFIGSKELFSKPLHQLNLQFEWASLPASLDFATYYKEYNYYPLTVETIQVPSTVQQPIPGTAKTRSVTTYTPKKVLKNNNYFNNSSFKTSFSYLSNGFWTEESGFIQSIPGDNAFDFLPQESQNAQQLLYFTRNDQLIGTSLFNAETQSQEEILFAADANLQLNNLTYSEKSSDGFLKMVLVQPEYGFGQEMYSKVIADVSLYNAANISKAAGDKDPAVGQPNVPYSPLVKSLTATYHASFRYDLTEIPIYPIECFSYIPFKVNKVLGQGFTKQEIETLRNFNFASATSTVDTKGIPLFTPVLNKAALLLKLDQLEGNENLNFYFQLTAQTGDRQQLNSISHALLSGDEWVETPVISDGTKAFRCSGILSLSIPASISNTYALLPESANWLAIGVNNSANAFAETLYLNTNGVELKRSGTAFLNNTTVVPFLKAGSISAAQSALPEVSKIVQPFASDGGRKAENQKEFRKRVSSRIATKGRMITASDYYSAIREEFPAVFFSHTFFDKASGTTTTCLMKKVKDATNATAFAPFFSPCELMEIEHYLLPKVSALTNTKVENFKPSFLGIQAQISLSDGVPESFLNDLGSMLDLYISPWIECKQEQAQVQQTISSNQITNFLKTFKEVQEVDQVGFLLMDKSLDRAHLQLTNQGMLNSLTPKANEVFVPCGQHFLTISSAV